MARIGNTRRTAAKLLAVFALLSMLLSPRLLFACDLMDGKSFSHCCCEDSGAKGCAMGDGCDLNGDEHASATDTDNMCCAVSVDEPPSYVSSTSSNGNIGVGALVEPSQPPPALLPTPLSLPAPQAMPAGAFPSTSPSVASYPATLLVTQRFRI